MNGMRPGFRFYWWAAATITIVAASPTSAQLNGVPIWAPGLPVSLVKVALTAHSTNGDDAYGDTGADWGGTFSVRGILAERVTFTGGVGAIRRNVAVSDQDWRPQYFLSAALNLVQGSDALGDYEYGISILSGYGTSTLPGASSEQNLPLGLDLLSHFNRGGWYFEISALPRWSWRRTNLGLGGVWQNGPGVTGTVTAGTTGGIALIVAVDKMWLRATSGTIALPETNPFAWSAGLRWAL
ncbi:MAG: hypothetical protein O7I93_03590 [Gemmatimonadetes bacterium]|nr:hypothetical protein [Gemmatimonadota bacterium]